VNRVELKHIPLKPASRLTGLPRLLHRVLFGLFLLQFAVVWVKLWLPLPWLGDTHSPEGFLPGFLLLLASATTCAGLGRQLPGQNVLLASILIAVLAGSLQLFGARTAIPFGPFVYDPDRIGQFLLPLLPWSVPFIWLVFILNSRGAARLILRPWRHDQAYGLRVIALTVLLVVLLDLAFEPFATRVKGYWSWKPTLLHSTWYDTPWVNFLGWTVSAALILAFTTPALIRKKPGNPPPDFHPLAVWLLLNLLFLTGAATRHLWAAVAVTSVQSVAVAGLALWGGNRSSAEHHRSEAG
jgi:uncharacterized membrane protein